MRHIHADMIIEWAETQKPVQARTSELEDWTDCNYPSWHNHIEYRFKPEVIRYKRFIDTNEKRLCLHIEGDIDPSRYFSSIKFIDTEWQEVEV